MTARGGAVRTLAALAAAVLVLGATAREGRAAFSYDLSLGVGAVVNDNLYNDPDEGGEGRRAPVSETMFTAAPALSLDWTAPRDRLSGAYRGSYWQFTGDEEIDARWVHTLAAGLGWRRWEPFFLEVVETLDYGPDPRKADVQAIIDYTYTNKAAVRAGLLWRYGARAEAELAYRGMLETYPDVDDADRILSQYGEGLVRYRWSPRLEGELGASYGHVERDLTPDYDELQVSAQLRQRLSERLGLRLRLEWLRDDYDAMPGAVGAVIESGVQDSLLGLVEARGDLVGGGFWRLAYEKDLDYLSDGDTLETGRASAGLTLKTRLGSSVGLEGWHEAMEYRISGREDKVWGTDLAARWLIAPWAAWDFLGTWESTTISRELLPEVDEDTFDAGTGILILLYDRLQLEAGYYFRTNDSSDPLRSYTSNRFYVFATYHFRRRVGTGLPTSVLYRLDELTAEADIRGW